MKKLLASFIILAFSLVLIACDQLTTKTTNPVSTDISSSEVSSTTTTLDGSSTSGTVTTNSTVTTIESTITTETTAQETTTTEELKVITISFDSMGGSNVDSQSIYLGEYLDLVIPIKDGYTFLGWFTENNEPIFGNTPVDESITLYAHWQEVNNDYYDDYLDLSVVHTMNDGEEIEVSGVVYYMTQNGYYIQDDTANLFIFTDRTAPDVELGSRVVVKGELTTYREVKQIKNPVILETNLFEQEINQEVINYEFGVTDLVPGKVYRITGEVRIEGTYDTAYLYVGNQKVAEIYYKSLEKSIESIKAYQGEIVTVDLLYYAVGDEVERYAFQGNQSHIDIAELEDSEALEKDVLNLPESKNLYSDYDFEAGFYGSTYEVVFVSESLKDYVSFLNSKLLVTRPEEATGDISGYIQVRVSLNDEVPMVVDIDITVKALGNETSDLAYYDSAEGLSGMALFNELNRIINNGFKQLSYDDAKWVLEESDRDPSNPNNVILVYTRESVPGKWNYPNWNREHTWPQSKLLASGQKADMHNLKPADVAENSRRGNLPFGYMSGSGVYEPHDDVKGDIARILFYMATMYPALNIDNLGDLDVLMQWHIIDPVDDFERNRNEVIYKYQKNRNPYIDNPGYVELVWGIIG